MYLVLYISFGHIFNMCFLDIFLSRNKDFSSFHYDLSLCKFFISLK